MLRNARPGDLDAIHAIERRSFKGDRMSRASISRLIGSPSAAVLVAADGRQVAAAMVLLFRRGSRLARLYSLAVASQQRGKGLGGRMIHRALALARRRGAAAICLEVRASNHRAQRLYRRHGFLGTRRTACYYQDGQDAVRMEMALTGGVA